MYGLQQAKGQAEVLWKAEELTSLIEKHDFPGSIKLKLKFISKVKDFAQSELGLAESKNYTTFYDQKGKPILWVVTASPEFEIKAYEWNFPLAGSFSYKGFFDLSKAKMEAEKLDSLGFDTEIDEVNAWSTLGWFRDPILSSMLERSEGSLAELIIHELTHATIYKKSEVEYNENLATLVGREGAKSFLEQEFGPSHPKCIEYDKRLMRKALFKRYLNRTKLALDSLYSSFSAQTSLSEKRKLKQAVIEDFKRSLMQSEYYDDQEEASRRLKNFHPNNAFFSGVSTYQSRQKQLLKQLEQDFNGNLKAFILHHKKESDS
jgi:predicted aminopeptidase